MSELITRQEQLITRQGEQLEKLTQVVVRLVAEVERLDRQAKRQMTITHKDYLALGRRISRRAAEYGEQYRVAADQIPQLRKSIRHAAQLRWKVTNLHDLPERDLAECQAYIDSWADFGAIMALRMEKRRASA